MPLDLRFQHVTAEHDRIIAAAEKTHAVVVEFLSDADILKPLVAPHVEVIAFGGPTMGRRFEEITMLAKPGRSGDPLRDRQENEWFAEALMTRLKPKGRMYWLVPHLELVK